MSDEAPTLDLSALDFRPAWAKDPGAAPSAPREFREPRPERGAFKRPGSARGGKPGGKFDGPRRGGPKPHGKKFDGPRRDDHQPSPPPPNPFPWLRIAFTATAPAVETVVAQVRHTGKTFSLFDIARILLRNPASYTIDLTSAPKQPEGPFWVVDADRSVWLNRESAVRHLLRKKRDDFYRAETVETEPPKGNFPVVAVCGMSGVLLGPPNHHDAKPAVAASKRGTTEDATRGEQIRGIKIEPRPAPRHAGIRQRAVLPGGICPVEASGTPFP